MAGEGRPEGGAAAEFPVEGLPEGFGEGRAGRVAFGIAVAFSAFQLWTAAYGTLPSQVVRAMHVGFLLLLGFALLANLRATSPRLKAWFWLLGVLGFATGLYNWVFYAELIRRAGFLTTADLAVGTLLIFLVFEAARRLMGPALAVMSGIFLAYCFFGQHLPPPFVHRGYDFAQIVETFAFGTEGIYGTPIYVSAAYIFIFVVFAAFLEKAGMIALFNDVALGVCGGWRGGPAQVCVMSSALMGTISGSGIANVVASGQFTIPLMKRFGFRAAFAGGVEATSSMGGQIMPPVMGAVAFIMAETLNIPYAEVVKAALIPALLYFGACFWVVYLEFGQVRPRGHVAGRAAEPVARHPRPLAAHPAARGARLPALRRLHPDLRRHHGARAHRRPDPRDAARGADRPLRLPPRLLGRARARRRRLPALGRRRARCWSSARWSPPARSSAAAARPCASASSRLAEGAKNAVPVGIACAIVGIVIGTLTLTGIASTFIGAIIAIGESNLFLSLFLTMVTCLILGMGIPTIPNYIITSSIAGPALLALDVPLLVSHMFVFYFGIMADLTPPVALAAFAAAPMARVSGTSIARPGDQARRRRLRRAVHGGLHPVADAAGRRRHRRGLRLSGRGRLRLPQGLPRHRALRRRGGRLPARAHAALGARPRRRGGDPARPRACPGPTRPASRWAPSSSRCTGGGCGPRAA